MATVLIGIQARSTSTRLPRKPFELVGSKRLLDHVIDAAKSAANYLVRHGARQDLYVDVAVLTPVDDLIVKEFRNRCDIHQGSEQDVLSRYYNAGKSYDWIVRLTGDCPLIPDYLIQKHVKTAMVNDYDYLSNVEEGVRTSIDGHDCEVMSKKMLEHLQQAATSAYDREHVTTLARSDPPSWAKMGFFINYQDHSDIKLSVDTPEDLARVRAEHEKREQKVYAAERRFGRRSVHRV